MAGLGPAVEHALISVLALNGLRGAEANGEPKQTGANIEALGLERGRTLTIMRTGGKFVTSPLRPARPGPSTWSSARRSQGPIFVGADRRRLDRHGAAPHRQEGGPPGRDHQGHRSAHPAVRLHHAASDAGVPLPDVQEAAHTPTAPSAPTPIAIPAAGRPESRRHYGRQTIEVGHTWRMAESSITAAGAIDTFLVLLIGIGPKLALVPFLEITATLDPATKRRVARKMLNTAAVVAVVLVALGELLRVLLHFTIGSLSIAGGVILLVLAVSMVLAPPDAKSHDMAGKDPMQLAQFPLAVPYLLNPVGIVALITISAEAKSLSVLALEVGILAFVLLLDVVVFRFANRVSERLDENRMLVTEKVFGFLVAAIAVQLVLDGLVSEGVIAPVPH